MKHRSYEDEFDRILGRQDKKRTSFVRHERHRAKTVYKRGDMVKVSGYHLAALVYAAGEPVFLRRFNWSAKQLVLIAASDSDEAIVWEDEKRAQIPVASNTWKFPIAMWPFLHGVDVVWFVSSNTSDPSEAMRVLYSTYFKVLK